jgi:glycosyltransferase involved in cell wall biosynthesis
VRTDTPSPSPLRILHVAPVWEEAWGYGGIPRLLGPLARAQAAAGHRVTVVATDARDSTSRIPAPHDFVERIGGGRLRVRLFRNLSNRLADREQLYLPLGMRAFLREIASSTDVAHLHAHRHLGEALAARALRHARVPWLSAPNGTAPRIERRLAAKAIWDATIGREILAGAAALLAVSEAERRELEALGLPPERIRVVPNPIDLEPFRFPPAAGEFRRRFELGAGPMLLSLGQLAPRKRVDLLLAAWARRKGQPGILVVAGNDRGAEPELRRLAGAPPLAGRVRFVGRLEGSERLAALADADLVVYPGEREVFGLVAVEAILCGTPVVVAGDSGCGELVGGLGGGIVLGSADPAELAAAIDEVLGAPEVWSGRIREAATKAAARLSPERIAGEIDRVYREMLGDSGRRAQ